MYKIKNYLHLTMYKIQKLFTFDNVQNQKLLTFDNVQNIILLTFEIFTMLKIFTEYKHIIFHTFNANIILLKIIKTIINNTIITDK